MATTADIPQLGPEEVKEFLAQAVPFTELDEAKLEELSHLFALKLFPKDTAVFRQDADSVDHFYLIYEGRVKTYLSGPDGTSTLLDFRGKGGFFGALAIIRASKANFNVETLEDTLCLALPKETFLALIRNSPLFAEHYLKSFSDDLASTAYAELRTRKTPAGTGEMLYLFNVHVGEVIRRPPEIIHGSRTIQQAAERMSELEIGSLLVEDQSGAISGIVTDKDLRKKVVAKALDFHAPVATVTTTPVYRIASDAMCFDALLHMMDQRVHHLAVERGGQIVGVVSVHDIMVQEGSSPLYLFREIVKQRTAEGLFPLSKKIPRVVRALVKEGAKANNITRIVTVLNDQIVTRLLSMLQEQMGPPPVPYCWITFGSEGRKEQTFKTDQDNALIYQDLDGPEDQMKQVRAYFRRFGQEAAQLLASSGFPLCKGKMMASNPRWRKPYAVWRGYFDNWMATPEPKEVLNATIFFDFRPEFGSMELGRDLRDHLTLEAPNKSFFLLFLAKDCMSGKTPLTFFKQFVVEKNGRHKNRVDLKTQGLTPFVNFARLMALRHGVQETNTLARLEALAEMDHVPRALYLETRDAYEFQMQLRLENQLKLIEAGKEPDNYVDPDELSDVDKQTLKEAFAVIGRVQAFVKADFKVME
jgi:CBS domain-containing protein